MATWVPAAKGQSLLVDRMVADIRQHYPAELDAAFGRTGDTADDGTYLPDPVKHYRRANPGIETGAQAGICVVYVGQYQPSQKQQSSSGDDQFGEAVGDGYLIDWKVPMRIMISCVPAPGWTATDPVTGRDLDEVEKAEQRIIKYISAMQQGVTRWATERGGYGNDLDKAWIKADIISDWSGTVQVEDPSRDQRHLRGRAQLDLHCFHRRRHPLPGSNP